MVKDLDVPVLSVTVGTNVQSYPLPITNPPTVNFPFINPSPPFTINPTFLRSHLAPLGVTHIRVSVRGIDSVTVAWDPPIGSGLSGYALTFDPLNLTLHTIEAEVTQYKFSGLEPEANYTVEVYVFSQDLDGAVLYSPPIYFNFSTCTHIYKTLFFSFGVRILILILFLFTLYLYCMLGKHG